MTKIKYTQNTDIKHIMKYFIAIIFVSFLGSCGTKTESQTEEQDNTTNLITLSKEQFDMGKIELGKIKKETFPEIVNTNGIFGVPPERKASVSAYFAGYVKDVNILEGEKVEKGQVLFTLENPDYINIQQNFLETKAQLKNLKSEYKRQEILYKENVSSKKSFLTAETNYLTTEAKYQSLRQQLKMMHLDPDNLTAKNIKTVINVISPIGGYLTDIRISNGIFLPPTDVALTIVNTDHLHLELSVYEKKLHNIIEGQEVRFSLLDQKDKEYKAEIIQVGKSIDPEKRTISVHSHLENDSLLSLFTVGMYVDARIYVSNDTLFALPNEAIVEVDGISYALLLDKYDNENKIFSFKNIKLKTGRKGEYFTEILNHNDFNDDSQFMINGAFNLIKD
ncbi:MAG: efflux RND transporter periplasmic adaptor subunit [Marinilabiliales bacterium]|mgnify:CR=1 FL=1|nr:MAG: efflux RND transporter periplasmic adaptor subunit [Marinilabiliales bacterium]